MDARTVAVTIGAAILLTLGAAVLAVTQPSSAGLNDDPHGAFALRDDPHGAFDGGD